MDNKNNLKENNFYDLRINYQNPPLREDHLHPSPITFFQQWFQEAQEAKEIEPNGMVFSSMIEGSPWRVRSRVVLLKEIEEDQFIFYSSLSGPKGREITQHACGSLNFWWRVLHRQVRIEGSVSLIDPQKNQNYFSSRPRESQLAVLTKNQSELLSSRDELLTKYKETTEQWKNTSSLPCPSNWGGLALTPNYFEFWQGQPNRLHDRLVYEKVVSPERNAVGHWKIYRLSP